MKGEIYTKRLQGLSRGNITLRKQELIMMIRSTTISRRVCSQLKKQFQHVLVSFLPGSAGNSYLSLSELVESLPNLYLEVFPDSPKPGCKISPSAIFRSKWVKHDPNPDRIEKKKCVSARFPIGILWTSFWSEKAVCGDFLQPDPFRTGKHHGWILERRPRHFGRR